MYYCLMYSSELIKGTLKTIVLRLLEQNGKMYGYEISKHVEALTHGKIVITEGALYPILHKLEADGAVLTQTETIGKRMRKYYFITEKGTTESKERASELLEFFQTIELLLAPKTSLG